MMTMQNLVIDHELHSQVTIGEHFILHLGS